MTQITLMPDDWPSDLESLRPGPFVWLDADLRWHFGFKTEYRNSEGDIEVYCDSGEALTTREGQFWPCSIKICDADGNYADGMA